MVVGFVPKKARVAKETPFKFWNADGRLGIWVFFVSSWNANVPDD